MNNVRQGRVFCGGRNWPCDGGVADWACVSCGIDDKAGIPRIRCPYVSPGKGGFAPGACSCAKYGKRVSKNWEDFRQSL